MPTPLQTAERVGALKERQRLTQSQLRALRVARHNRKVGALQIPDALNEARAWRIAEIEAELDSYGDSVVLKRKVPKNNSLPVTFQLVKKTAAAARPRMRELLAELSRLTDHNLPNADAAEWPKDPGVTWFLAEHTRRVKGGREAARLRAKFEMRPDVEGHAREAIRDILASDFCITPNAVYRRMCSAHQWEPRGNAQPGIKKGSYLAKWKTFQTIVSRLKNNFPER